MVEKHQDEGKQMPRKELLRFGVLQVVFGFEHFPGYPWILFGAGNLEGRMVEKHQEDST